MLCYQGNNSLCKKGYIKLTISRDNVLDPLDPAIEFIMFWYFCIMDFPLCFSGTWCFSYLGVFLYYDLWSDTVVIMIII